MLDRILVLSADLDEGDQLSKFFGLIQHYNEKAPLDLTLQTQIEDYFEYKWQNDLNQAIDDPEEEKILEQLPVAVQDRLYSEFLFADFLTTFK